MTNEELTIELQRAYRCIQGMSKALSDGKSEFPAEGYHALTIGAAKLFVFVGELVGSRYFEGKHYSVLHDALNLGRKQND